MSSDDDPIITHFKVQGWRGVYFIGAATVQAICLWAWFWLHFEPERGWRGPINHLPDAWPLDSGTLPAVLALAFLWIGVANTGLAFLLTGRWWQHRAEVLHRRGSRFIDQRGVR